MRAINIEKLRAITCECHWTMTLSGNGNTLECINPDCRQYHILYYAPEDIYIELEKVELNKKDNHV